MRRPGTRRSWNSLEYVLKWKRVRISLMKLLSKLMVSTNSLESSMIGSRQYALDASCLDILIPYVLQKKWHEKGKEKISDICDTSNAAGLQSLQAYQGLSDMEVVQAQGILLNSAIAHKGINLEIVISPQGLELAPAPLIEDSLIMSDLHQKASNAIILTNQCEALNHVEELVIEEGPRVSILADSTVHGKAMIEESMETEGNAKYNRAVSMVNKLRSKNKADKRLSVTHAGLKEKLRAASKQPLPAILAIVSKKWEAKMALIQQEIATCHKKEKIEEKYSYFFGGPLCSVEVCLEAVAANSSSSSSSHVQQQQ